MKTKLIEYLKRQKELMLTGFEKFSQCRFRFISTHCQFQTHGQKQL